MPYYNPNRPKVKFVILFSEYVESWNGDEYYRPAMCIVWSNECEQEIVFDDLCDNQPMALQQARVRLGDRFYPVPSFIYDLEV
jgi:hypothetical protein